MIYCMGIDHLDTMGRRIKAAREHIDMTQVVLCERLGIRQAYMSQIENDHSMPPADLIARVAAALNVSADYLLLATDDPEPPKSSLNQIVVDVVDPGERALIEEWIDLIQDMTPEQRRSLLQSLRLLLAPYGPPRIIGG